MRILLPLIFCTASFCLSTSYASGIQVGRTRIIYEANKKEVALPLINKEKELPWLVQSWIDTGDEKQRGPFIITPPLFRIDPQKEQSLRISWSGAAIANDRESLFYLNVRTIPAIEKTDDKQNVLRLIYKTRLKLFWRPQGLRGTPGETCKNLEFSQQGDSLVVTNHGDYYSIFDSVRIGNVTLRNADLVAPKSSATIAMPKSTVGQSISWRCITDYGNASEPFTALLSRR